MKIAAHTQRAPAEASLLDEIKTLRGHAKAICRFVRNARFGRRLHNLALELKLRMEQEAGKLIARLHLRGGSHHRKSNVATLKLSDVGINKHESARLQLEAAVPEATLEEYLADAAAGVVLPSRTGFLRIAKELRAGRAYAAKRSRKAGNSQRKRRDKRATADAEVVQQRTGKTADFESQLANALSAIVELKNHHGQLAELVKRVCKPGQAVHDPLLGDQIARLLSDCRGLLQDLKQYVRKLSRTDDGG